MPVWPVRSSMHSVRKSSPTSRSRAGRSTNYNRFPFTLKLIIKRDRGPVIPNPDLFLSKTDSTPKRIPFFRTLWTCCKKHSVAHRDTFFIWHRRASTRAARTLYSFGAASFVSCASCVRFCFLSPWKWRRLWGLLLRCSVPVVPSGAPPSTTRLSVARFTAASALEF